MVSAESAFLVTHLLRGVMRQGTGKASLRWGLSEVTAGKTGTTDGLRDAWFVGYTPNGYTTAVWMGYRNGPDDGPPRYMNSVHGRVVYGGTFPATIWNKYMKVLTDGMDVGDFVTPTSFPGKQLNSELSTTSSTGTTVPDTSTTAGSSTTAPASSTTAPANSTTSIPESTTTPPN